MLIWKTILTASFVAFAVSAWAGSLILTKGAIPLVPVNTSIPTISGTPQVGQTLTATNGTWTNSPTSFTYQWNRGVSPIGGATASTYVPVSADVGNTLTASVVAANGSGSSAPATSTATAAVIDIIPTINTVASIPGTPMVGSATTATDATWNHSVTSRAYQWKSAGVNATGAGATTLTYTPVTGDVGNTLTITVTATNSGGTSAPSTSAASATVVAAGSAFTLPSYNDVTANWAKAGLAVIGGIPTRSQCGATLTPNGTDDWNQIQTALTACPVGQAVQLGPGTFKVTMAESLVLIKGITLRGTGTCNNGSSPYCQTEITVSNGQLPTYAGGGQCGTDTSHIVSCTPRSVIDLFPKGLFEQTWSHCLTSVNATGCSTALDADAAQGQTTIRVHSQANLAVGMWIRIDEAAAAATQTDPSNASGTVFAASDFTASSGSPATGKIAYAGAGVEDGAAYGSLYDRETSEIHLISALGAGPCPGVNCTVTFDSPLTIAYRQSGNHFAQIYWPDDSNGSPMSFVQQAGVENLTVSRATSGPIYMAMCAYCWISNVEARGWVGGIAFNNVARSEIINSYIHDCVDCENNGVEYPLAVDGATTESLFSNNIIRLAGKGMVGRSSGGGNVVSYNYQDDTFYMAQVIGNWWLDLGINGSHYVGSHHTLFEGNYGTNCDNDETHGNAVYHTFFRNWCAGFRTPFNDPSFTTTTSVTYNPADAPVNDTSSASCGGVGPSCGYATGNTYPWGGGNGLLRAGAAMRWDYWMAFVGNVLGVSGVTTTGNGWSYETNAESNKEIWMLGWAGGECQGCSDKFMNGTSGRYYLRHGNYDYLNNSIVDWQAGMSHTLPSSFYLSSVPSFFTGASCTYSWPWVTPNGGSPVQTNSCSGSGLPAKARFEAGTPFIQP